MQIDDGDDFLPPDLGALHAEESVGAEGGEGQASTVLEQHRADLMSREGAEMVGETVDASGRPAILIGVRDKSALSQVPSTIDQIPVVVQVIGEVRAQ